MFIEWRLICEYKRIFGCLFASSFIIIVEQSFDGLTYFTKQLPIFKWIWFSLRCFSITLYSAWFAAYQMKWDIYEHVGWGDTIFLAPLWWWWNGWELITDVLVQPKYDEIIPSINFYWQFIELLATMAYFIQKRILLVIRTTREFRSMAWQSLNLKFMYVSRTFWFKKTLNKKCSYSVKRQEKKPLDFY